MTVNMYIDPFWAGVATVILVEFIALVAVAVIGHYQDKKIKK